MRIYKLGEEVLRKKCAPVETITPELKQTFEEMFTLMLEANGVGLAAPQVGISQRFFVVIADDDVRRVFVNPTIVATSQEMCDFEEGCLSIPGVYENIRRPAKVTVSALNENGKPFTLEADGLLARVIQHENDHLDGTLYIDKGDPEFAAKTNAQFLKRLERAQKKEAEKERKRKSLEAKLAAKAAKNA